MTVVCPKCGARLMAPATAQRIQCGKCQAVFAPSDIPATPGYNTAAAVGVCILVIIGLVMSIQPVTLLTGSGTAWIGVAIVGAGAALAFFLRTRTSVRVVAILVLALALYNVLVVENKMSDKREQISRTLNR